MHPPPRDYARLTLPPIHNSCNCQPSSIVAMTTSCSSPSSKDQSPNKSETHLSPQEQQQKVWSSLLAHNNSRDSDQHDEPSNAREWPPYDVVMSDVTSSDYNETLQCPHDLRMVSGKGKEKALCPHGVVCCAKLELFPPPKDGTSYKHCYTGLLSPDKTVQHCLLRLSSAMKPPNEEITSRVGRALLYAAGHKLRNAKLFPTAAIKVFRDGGVQSGNLLFGGCKVGQHEEDYFAHCLCTQLTERMPRTVKPFVKSFWKYSDYPLSLGISEFCTFDENGNASKPHFPFCLILSPCRHPSQEKKSGSNDQTDNTPRPSPRGDYQSFDSFLDDVLSIPPGTALYDLFACPNPESVPDASKIQRIGRIVTTSSMCQSGSNDGLFIRHQRKEEDYDLRPEWKESIQSQCSIGKTVGTISKLAGWELFEEHIQKGTYVDFEMLSKEEETTD